MADDPVKAAGAELAEAEPQEQASDGTIRYEDPETGEIWEGKPTEVAEKLFAGKREANRLIRQQKEETSFLRKQVEAHGLGDREAEGDGKFDQEQYLRLLASDAVKANEYVLEHTPVARRIKALERDVEGFRTNAQIVQFHGNIGRNELSREEYLAVADRVRQDELPPNSIGMELAYSRLQREGKIREADTHDQARRRGNPRLDGQGQREAATSDDQANTMPLDQLRRKAWGQQ